MAETDALKTFKFPRKPGLFTTFEDGEPVKLRVLTTDPVVSTDQWGNTRFAFVVWNYTLGRAQILNRGASIAKEIQKLHQDEDYGANIKKIDIKITADGSGKETRYTVIPLPKAETLSNEQIRECQEINLDEKVEGQRMSFYKPEEIGGDKEDGDAEVEARVERVLDEGEPINLDDIPF